MIISKLTSVWEGMDHPVLISSKGTVSYRDIIESHNADLSFVTQGDVVALVGDFNPESILTLLRLIEIGAIVVPLTTETRVQHEYFFEQANVRFVLEDGRLTERFVDNLHPLLLELRKSGSPGLVLFTTGTTGAPKAILHDLSLFLQRFDTPRPAFRTLGFLLFDHIGGINTLFHTLFNRGIVVSPSSRDVETVLNACATYSVEVMPTTPTFLRMLLLSGRVPTDVPDSLKVITYGTERMDESTLKELCRLLPTVDFRQTYGMSELGILRVKSEARDSLFMKVGGEGVETRVVDNVLEIRSASRMLGYLNAASPFSEDVWYRTMDIVETRGDFVRIIGRVDDVVNVGGLKFTVSDVESVALAIPGVLHVKVLAKSNPISGQHVELIIQPSNEATFEIEAAVSFLRERLPEHMMPRRVKIGTIAIGHRFKRA